MTRVFMVLVSLILLSFSASAQQSSYQDPFLDHLIGRWTLQGKIEGQAKTHNVVAEWVLNHQYARIHEVSHERDDQGRPSYEAMVFIGWDSPSKSYACLWLDSTSGAGLDPRAIGYGKRTGDRIEFQFKGGDGSVFHTTFVYGGETDTWQWLMDGEANGKLEPFARLTLTRK